MAEPMMLREWFFGLLGLSAFFWPLGWPFWANVLLAIFIVALDVSREMQDDWWGCGD